MNRHLILGFHTYNNNTDVLHTHYSSMRTCQGVQETNQCCQFRCAKSEAQIIKVSTKYQKLK